MTALQKKILDCLAQGMNTNEIMEACECSESSVKHVRANKKLRAAYEALCIEQVQRLVPRVIIELERIISSPKTLDTVKLAAAKQIIELSRINEAVRKPEKQDITIKVEYV